MAGLPESTVHVWFAEPPGTDRELFQMLLERLGSRFIGDSRVLALGVLRDLLLKLHAAGGRCLVVVDESHKFSNEGLEAIRLLNNLEQGAAKLVQVLMLGQEELTEMLTGKGREAFRQRITNLEILGCMKPAQVCDYIRHRLRVAGGDPQLFPDLILEAIAAAAMGIPRLTNSLCDRALRNAFEGGRLVVGAKDLLQAAEEIGVDREAFHFLVGQERVAAESSEAASSAVGPAEPAPWTCPRPEIVPPAATGGESASTSETPRRTLLVPLALLAGGIVALAASLVFYCSRTTALSGGDCLLELAQDIFRR
jgi:general secretion pathway protein A